MRGDSLALTHPPPHRLYIQLEDGIRAESEVPRLIEVRVRDLPGPCVHRRLTLLLCMIPMQGLTSLREAVLDAEDEFDDAKVLSHKLEKRQARGRPVSDDALQRARTQVSAKQASFTRARSALADATDVLRAYGDNGFPEADAAV